MRDANSTNHARKVELADIVSIMKQQNGRSFLFRQLKATGYFEDVFSNDPYHHANRAGRRAHGVWLMNELNDAAPELVQLMMKENTDV